ncbi:uncharacterized protein LOC142177216 [Nicotiana tabacum]|uniref:Uncharacterized protein LOC142177216 n=1 Tax=Nicotiana tabacum TaxID=4097 RepID=A0AC58TX42_TOBAC
MKADQRHATSKLISGYIIDNLRDPRFEVTQAFVMVEMQKLHGLDIGYHKAWRAIQRASTLIRGTPEENYELLSSYLYMMKISKDANNQIFPLAFRIAESENNNSYEWHQSIAHDIAKVYPESHHGICIYHLEQNLKRRKVKSEVIKLFQSAARVYKRKEFDLYMSDIAKVDKKTFDYLMEEPPKRSKGAAYIKNDGFHPSEATTFSTLKVFPVDSWRSRVKEEGITFVVDLNKRTCDCFQFQFDELPCIHTIAAIEKRNIKKSNFCSDWYLKKSWLKTYERQIHPVGHTDSWIVPESANSQIIKPPDFKVPPGRRQKKRHISATESSKITFKCGRCRRIGHNRISCIYSPAVYPFSRKHRE